MKGKEVLEWLKKECDNYYHTIDTEVDMTGKVTVDGQINLVYKQGDKLLYIRVPVFMSYQISPDDDFKTEVIE
jgi:sensor domain CHASE-containing protein